MTVKFRLPGGHHLTLNYSIYDSEKPAQQERGREQFLALVDATGIACNENSTLPDILPLMIGRQVMVEYQKDVGGSTIPAITYDGHFWHEPDNRKLLTSNRASSRLAPGTGRGAGVANTQAPAPRFDRLQRVVRNSSFLIRG